MLHSGYLMSVFINFRILLNRDIFDRENSIQLVLDAQTENDDITEVKSVIADFSQNNNNNNNEQINEKKHIKRTVRLQTMIWEDASVTSSQLEDFYNYDFPEGDLIWDDPVGNDDKTLTKLVDGGNNNNNNSNNNSNNNNNLDFDDASLFELSSDSSSDDSNSKFGGQDQDHKINTRSDHKTLRFNVVKEDDDDYDSDGCDDVGGLEGGNDVDYPDDNDDELFALSSDKE
jgi:hypothetical protein